MAPANGFAGTVATPTTTPVITLTTSVTGLLKGNGAAIGAAVADTDYATPAGVVAYAVPVTRTVNGQPLSANVTITTISGNAATATALATGRTLAMTGDVTWTSPAFDGSGNVTAAGTLATVNSNVGSFTSANITVDAKGRITAAASGTSNPGTVTTVSVVSANGFAGTVRHSDDGAFAITLTTSVTGLVKGNGTSLLLAVADTDYLTPATAASTYVPVTRTVNGHALSSIVTVTAADVGSKQRHQ